MKIVLLPGLDGTGNLFNPLLKFIPEENVTVIALPMHGEQTYSALAAYCKGRMPREPYILVTESFSGPIGLMLAAIDDSFLKKLILVATFASPPKPFVSKLCSYLPLKQLIRLPLSGIASRILFLGFNTPSEIIEGFMSAVALVPSGIMKKRLQVASSFRIDIEQINKPVVYIQPTTDFLVPNSCYSVVSQFCPNITLQKVKGPHFILQANPKVCSEIITSGLGI